MERLISIAQIIFLSISLLAFSSAYAASGCCSHHGGVKGCDSATNHELCNDGTNSPTCLCSGGTQKKSKAAHSSVTATTASTTAASTTNTKKTTKGCCSRHGGVAGCDSTGYSKCKDGSVSTTCKC